MLHSIKHALIRKFYQGGGQTLTFFLLLFFAFCGVFLVDEGREDLNTTISRHAKLHLNGVSFACR